MREIKLEPINISAIYNNIAIIHKKPIPIKIVKVDYPSRSGAVIKEAYYKVPSTTDYNGIYKGKYIDFDAKETNSKTSMPLKNVHEHQINHLRSVFKQGGIAFLIVHFKKYNQYFLLPAEILFSYWDTQHDKEKGRKSIPYTAFLEKAHLISFGYQPRLDYIKVIDQLLLKK